VGGYVATDKLLNCHLVAKLFRPTCCVPEIYSSNYSDCIDDMFMRTQMYTCSVMIVSNHAHAQTQPASACVRMWGYPPTLQRFCCYCAKSSQIFTRLHLTMCVFVRALLCVCVWLYLM